MKVLITKRFEEKYIKVLKKYFDAEELAEVLKNKSHTFISLHDPFFKFKNSIKCVDFRWVLAYLYEDNIIPLFIFLKKDKKYWENISWKNNEAMIETEFLHHVQDIEAWDYTIY